MGTHKALFFFLHRKSQQCPRLLNATVTQPVTNRTGKEKLGSKSLSLSAGL
jgi:hypothetical protein